MMWNLEFTA